MYESTYTRSYTPLQTCTTINIPLSTRPADQNAKKKVRSRGIHKLALNTVTDTQAQEHRLGIDF